MTIFNQNNVKFSNNLLELLGIKNTLPFIAFIKRLTSPSTYFIHCDLVDKRQNLVKGKPSTVLARFVRRGKPFEKVYYQTAQQYVLRDTSTGDYDVNSLTISVRDEKGELFDFNNMPLKYIPRTIMGSANVLPSAPEYAETLYPMQKITQINAEDFRLKKNL